MDRGREGSSHGGAAAAAESGAAAADDFAGDGGGGDGREEEARQRAEMRRSLTRTLNVRIPEESCSLDYAIGNDLNTALRIMTAFNGHLYAINQESDKLRAQQQVMLRQLRLLPHFPEDLYNRSNAYRGFYSSLSRAFGRDEDVLTVLLSHEFEQRQASGVMTFCENFRLFFPSAYPKAVHMMLPNITDLTHRRRSIFSFQTRPKPDHAAFLKLVELALQEEKRNVIRLSSIELTETGEMVVEEYRQRILCNYYGEPGAHGEVAPRHLPTLQGFLRASIFPQFVSSAYAEIDHIADVLQSRVPTEDTEDICESIAGIEGILDVINDAHQVLSWMHRQLCRKGNIYSSLPDPTHVQQLLETIVSLRALIFYAQSKRLLLEGAKVDAIDTTAKISVVVGPALQQGILLPDDPKERRYSSTNRHSILHGTSKSFLDLETEHQNPSASHTPKRSRWGSMGHMSRRVLRGLTGKEEPLVHAVRYRENQEAYEAFFNGPYQRNLVHGGLQRALMDIFLNGVQLVGQTPGIEARDLAFMDPLLDTLMLHLRASNQLNERWLGALEFRRLFLGVLGRRVEDEEEEEDDDDAEDAGDVETTQPALIRGTSLLSQFLEHDIESILRSIEAGEVGKLVLLQNFLRPRFHHFCVEAMRLNSEESQLTFFREIDTLYGLVGRCVHVVLGLDADTRGSHTEKEQVRTLLRSFYELHCLRWSNPYSRRGLAILDSNISLKDKKSYFNLFEMNYLRIEITDSSVLHQARENHIYLLLHHYCHALGEHHPVIIQGLAFLLIQLASQNNHQSCTVRCASTWMRLFGSRGPFFARGGWTPRALFNLLRVWDAIRQAIPTWVDELDVDDESDVGDCVHAFVRAALLQKILFPIVQGMIEGTVFLNWDHIFNPGTTTARQLLEATRAQLHAALDGGQYNTSALVLGCLDDVRPEDPDTALSEEEYIAFKAFFSDQVKACQVGENLELMDNNRLEDILNERRPRPAPGPRVDTSVGAALADAKARSSSPPREMPDGACACVETDPVTLVGVEALRSQIMSVTEPLISPEEGPASEDAGAAAAALQPPLDGKQEERRAASPTSPVAVTQSPVTVAPQQPLAEGQEEGRAASPPPPRLGLSRRRSVSPSLPIIPETGASADDQADRAAKELVALKMRLAAITAQKQKAELQAKQQQAQIVELQEAKRASVALAAPAPALAPAPVPTPVLGGDVSDWPTMPGGMLGGMATLPSMPGLPEMPAMPGMPGGMPEMPAMPIGMPGMPAMPGGMPGMPEMPAMPGLSGGGGDPTKPKRSAEEKRKRRATKESRGALKKAKEMARRFEPPEISQMAQVKARLDKRRINLKGTQAEKDRLTLQTTLKKNNTKIYKKLQGQIRCLESVIQEINDCGTAQPQHTSKLDKLDEALRSLQGKSHDLETEIDARTAQIEREKKQQDEVSDWDEDEDEYDRRVVAPAPDTAGASAGAAAAPAPAAGAGAADVFSQAARERTPPPSPSHEDDDADAKNPTPPPRPKRHDKT